MSDDVLASAQASPGRRWLGVGSWGLLGALLIWMALVTQPALGWRLVLLVFGIGGLWQARAMWRATQHRLELTRSELRSSDGTLITPIEEIAQIERGIFAFKPSNGFLLRTKRPIDARNWQPGLWWRMGRRIGVGGVTAAHQTKPMSEIITAMLAERGD